MLRKLFLAMMITASSSIIAEEAKYDVDQLSEAFGNFLGRSFSDKNKEFPLNFEKVVEGMRKGQRGEPSPLTEAEYQQAVTAFQKETRDKIAEINLAKAKEFIKNNASAKDFTTLVEDKLYYQLVERGKGPAVTEKSAPLIHYKGSYIDGTVFGSSEKTGPVSIPLSGSIQGFRMGLAGMQEGEKRRLYIHPDLAYGTDGALPPNSLLIFDVEVIKVDPSSDEQVSVDAK